MSFGINGAELIILIILAVLILGPEKLPEYARKLTQWIRQLRQMAEGAKSQFKEETGTDFDEIDWKRYDPRQYDPRRIIKDALAEPVQDMRSTAREVWDHDAVREDLRSMDPRDLVRGRTGSTAAGATAVAAGAATTRTADDGRSDEQDAAQSESGEAAENSAHEVPAAQEETPLPAPFDTEAT